MRAEDKANSIKCYQLENLGEGFCVIKNLALSKERTAFCLWFLGGIYVIPDRSMFV